MEILCASWELPFDITVFIEEMYLIGSGLT